MKTKRRASPIKKTQEYYDLRRDVTALMKALAKSKTKRVEADLTPHLYSTIEPYGTHITGSDLANELFSTMFDKAYTLTLEEARFFRSNAKDIASGVQALVPSDRPLTLVSIGCGPHVAVLHKDDLLIRSMNITNYVAIDKNKLYAMDAARAMSSVVCGGQTYSLVCDFTKPFDLDYLAKDTQIIYAFFGATLGQFPLANDPKDKLSGGTTLNALLQNLGNVSDNRAIMLASIDNEDMPDMLVTNYAGRASKRMMDTLWLTVKRVVADRTFNTEALHYIPTYNPRRKSVDFTFVARKDTSLKIDDVRYPIPRGTEITIGCSKKLPLEELAPACIDAGWQVLPFGEKLNIVSPTRLLTLAGNNFQPKG